jgi:hypothetical protein
VCGSRRAVCCAVMCCAVNHMNCRLRTEQNIQFCS